MLAFEYLRISTQYDHLRTLGIPNFFPTNEDDDVFSRVSEHKSYGIWKVEESFSSHPAIASTCKVYEIFLYLVKSLSLNLGICIYISEVKTTAATFNLF